jgi:hypothetical protein
MKLLFAALVHFSTIYPPTGTEFKIFFSFEQGIQKDRGKRVKKDNPQQTASKTQKGRNEAKNGGVRHSGFPSHH